jgi:carbamoyltransferase
MDIAKSVQEVTEEVILRMARTAYELTGEKKLCMAGGVALNCVANGRLLREGPFKEIWIQPAAGDSGCALGAAYDVWHEYFLQDRHLRDDGLPAQMASCWGPAFSEHEVKAYLDTHGFPYRHIDEDEKAKVLSTAVADGKIVGHFSGRLEFGPRALGNRSIIGDPRNASTQVDMNLKIKYRESFRPFAPSVLREDVAEYFEINCDSPYMLLVAPVRADRRIPFQMPENFEDMLEIVKQPRSDISAITHVDFSARIQTVSRELSSEYYRLIKNFKDKTTCAVVVNTSFNVRGEPIVCTPADAYRCFMRTEMNILAIGNFVLIKEEQPEWPEGKGVGLEDEKNDVVTTKSIYNRRFLEKLRLMHKEEFIPLVEKLKLKGKLKISHSVTCQSSSWMDYNEPSDIKKIFEYGAAMLDRTKGPERLAEEIVAVWQHKDDVPEMKPILLKLLVLGLEFPAKLNLDEDVPDSVYAMF